MSKKKVGHLSLSCFVSSHGFGHASRVAAVMQSLTQRVQNLNLLIFGETPEWFWRLNLPHQGCTYQLVHTKTDIGLVQNGPFAHDLQKTLKEVTDLLSFSSPAVNKCRTALVKHRPDLVLCDISPLGIILAKEVDIPVVLLENFTWDWIYQAYEKEDCGFSKIITSLHKIYSEVDFHIQCEPYCLPRSSTQKVDPVFRAISDSSLRTKRSLGIDNNEEFALLTTGGIAMQHLVPKNSEIILVIPGNHDRVKRDGQIIFIPMKVSVPFTSLVHAASCVIGKAGYGTVAECWGTQTPFLGVFRDSFRESNILRNFCQKRLQYLEISLSCFTKGSWLEHLAKFKKSDKDKKKRNSGSIQVAEYILKNRLQ